MIYHLNELAMDFRRASIEELTYEGVEDFLKEVQRVYSYLNIDEQLEAQELWIGVSRGGVVIDTYHNDKFYPVLILKEYLTKSKKQVRRLYGELYGVCYTHKTTLEDFACDYLYNEDEIFIPDSVSPVVSEDKATNSTGVEKSTNLHSEYKLISIDDIEFPF